MRRPPIRLLDVAGTPEAIGRAHGEAYAGEIAAQAEDRIALVASGLWSGTPMPRADVLDLAAVCLRAHERHSPALYAELCGIVEGAGITPAEAIVAGGFTDFVDTVRNHTRPSTADEDDCTAVLVPDGRADGAGLYARHGTCMPAPPTTSCCSAFARPARRRRSSSPSPGAWASSA